MGSTKNIEQNPRKFRFSEWWGLGTLYPRQVGRLLDEILATYLIEDQEGEYLEVPYKRSMSSASLT